MLGFGHGRSPSGASPTDSGIPGWPDAHDRRGPSEPFYHDPSRQGEQLAYSRNAPYVADSREQRARLPVGRLLALHTAAGDGPVRQGRAQVDRPADRTPPPARRHRPPRPRHPETQTPQTPPSLPPKPNPLRVAVNQARRPLNLPRTRAYWPRRCRHTTRLQTTPSLLGPRNTSSTRGRPRCLSRCPCIPPLGTFL